jgi:hypothetical protein
LFLALVPIVAVPSQGLPRIDPAPTVARVAAMSEPLPLDVLAESALVFSGAEDEAIKRGISSLDALISDFRLVASDEGDPVVLAEMALVFMHERVLTRYVEEQTRLDVLLETGVYNCVSSAVLYAVLVRSVDIGVYGVRTEDHAFCAVDVNGRQVDVETTNVYGFNPGEKREFHDAFGSVTGYSYVPANRDPTRRQTGERGLLSLILENLASLATKDRRFADAVPPAVDAFSLARDDDAFEKLTVSISNMVSSLSVQGRFEDAVGFLALVADRHGLEPRLQRLRSDVIHNWIVSVAERGDLDRAISLARGQREAGNLAESQWKELMVSLIQLQAQAEAREDYLLALRTIREGIGMLGMDARLLRSERVYQHNFEVEVHNSMATAYNAGKLEEARLILEEALGVMPDSERIKKDLDLVQRAMQQAR